MPAVSNLTLRARLPGKTVFILGSGFSRPLGVPVIDDFIPEGLALLKDSAWLKGLPNDGDVNLLNNMAVLLHHYSDHIAQLDGGIANLEDIFCLVDLFGEKHERDTLKHFISRVCARAWECHEKKGTSTRECKPRATCNAPAVQIKYYFHDKEKTGPNLHEPKFNGRYDVCLYQAFLSQVLYGPRAELQHPELIEKPDYAENAIISLNYDLVIEREAVRFPGVRVFYGEGVLLSSANVPKSIVATRSELFAPHESRCLPLIKLHGSLNWKDPENDGAIGQCGMTELDAAPLILPTWQRNPIGERPRALLSEARNHLRLASKLVFIGYSMPQTDRYLRYLFSDSLATSELPEIEICNWQWSEAKAHDVCKRMLGPRAAGCLKKVYAGGLEDYVCASPTPDPL